jgi:hypothetical protein
LRPDLPNSGKHGVPLLGIGSKARVGRDEEDLPQFLLPVARIGPFGRFANIENNPSRLILFETAR